MTSSLPKLIVIVGPTACGKSQLALRVAKKYHGAIVSADSRQIYKKMTIGSGKERGTWQPFDEEGEVYTVDGVPHFMTDMIDPGRTYTVAEFRSGALEATGRIQKKGLIPILVGGTGLYVRSIVDNLNMPAVPPNNTLRKSFETKSLIELGRLLRELDPGADAFLDFQNPRRVIRALEVCILTGEPFSKLRLKGEPLFDILQIGIELPMETLRTRISARIDAMVAQGLWDEIVALRAQKYSWKLPSMSGIGYLQWQGYEEGTVSLADTIEHIKKDTYAYAKRQMTWFGRDTTIAWVTEEEKAEALVSTFLQN